MLEGFIWNPFIAKFKAPIAKKLTGRAADSSKQLRAAPAHSLDISSRFFPRTAGFDSVFKICLYSARREHIFAFNI